MIEEIVSELSDPQSFIPKNVLIFVHINIKLTHLLL
jgi:hypothetical protein